MAKKAPKKVIEELELVGVSVEENPLTKVSKFQLKQMIWKYGAGWNIMLVLHSSFEKVYTSYDVKFTFDEEPYARRITTVQDNIAMMKDEASLFDKVREQNIKDLEKEIADIEDEKESAKKACKDIEFPARVVNADWRGNEPTVIFAIKSEVVERLNREKDKVGQYYKIALTPVIE
jgi:hypothetical protein